MKNGNIVAEKIKIEEHHFVDFDKLPRVMREALANAPYSMAVGEIVEWYERMKLSSGMDDLMIAEVLLGKFRAFIAKKTKDEVFRLYGPDHPQAGPQ